MEKMMGYNDLYFLYRWSLPHNVIAGRADFTNFRVFFPPNINVIVLFCSSSLVHSGPDRGSPHSGTELFFATRTGTRLGIEAHLFRVETTKDLSLWTRHIVNGCHASAEMIKEVTTSKRSWRTT